MTSKQESKLSMYLAEKDLLNSSSNTTILTALPNCNAYVTSFNANVVALHAVRVQQETNTKGLGENKKELRVDLETKALDVANKVKAYAVNTSNSLLKGEVDYTKSKLEKSPDTILRDITQLIYNRANANAAALVTYGVTAANLTALQTAITAYLTAIPKPRTGIVTTKLATKQLAELFTATDAILEKIDVLVETLKFSNPSFWKNYVDTRKVIDAKHTKFAFRGKVVDKLNAEVLSGVKINIKNTTIKVKTTEKGNFIVKSLSAGSYGVVFSKNGYKDYTLTANITDNERTDVAVEMEKI